MKTFFPLAGLTLLVIATIFFIQYFFDSVLINTLLVFAILLTFVYIGWATRTSHSEEYHTENRKTGSLRTMASIFTVIGAPHFAIFATLAIFYGFWSLAFYIGILAGWVAFAFIVKKARNYIPDDAHSFPDIAAKEVGRSTALILTITGLLFAIGVVVAQYILGAQLIEAISGINYTASVLLIGLVVFVYLYWGGYKAILTTDLFQGLMMFLFTLILILFVFGTATSENINQVFTYGSSLPLLPIIPLLFIGGFLAGFGATSTWQRVLNAKSDEVARKSLINAGIIALVWGSMIVLLGLFILVTNPDINPGTAFIDFVISGLPVWVVGVVIVALLTSLISTSDTEIFMSSILFGKESSRKNKNKLEVKKTRKLIALFSLLSVLGALFLQDLQQAFGVLLNLAYISGPIAMAIVIGRGGKTQKIKQKVYLSSLTLAFISFIAVWIFINDFFSWWALIIIGISSFPLLIKGSSK